MLHTQVPIAKPEDRAHGVDLSKYQQYFKPPEETPYPIDFIIQRLSYGLITDEKMAVMAADIALFNRRPDPAAVMAYQYYSTAVPGIAQAEKILRIVESKPADLDYRAIWWDIEHDYNNLNESAMDQSMIGIEWLEARYSGRVGVYANISTYIAVIQRWGNAW